MAEIPPTLGTVLCNAVNAVRVDVGFTIHKDGRELSGRELDDVVRIMHRPEGARHNPIETWGLVFSPIQPCPVPITDWTNNSFNMFLRFEGERGTYRMFYPSGQEGLWDGFFSAIVHCSIDSSHEWTCAFQTLECSHSRNGYRLHPNPDGSMAGRPYTVWIGPDQAQMQDGILRAISDTCRNSGLI